MESLSLVDAHALLMGEDILPLSADDTDFDESMLPDASEALENVGTKQAEQAAFEAVLDAAFGKSDDPQVSLSEEDESAREVYHAEEVEIVRAQKEGAHSFNDGMVGLGVDIVEIERMRIILSRSPKFASRVFSLQEQIYCDTKSNPAAHYAVRFAAKEAVVKALGTGFSKGIGVRDIEVLRDKNGRPEVKLTGFALRVAQSQQIVQISLSMSYTKTDAVACALALTQSALRATEKRKDPLKELTRQFKETRKLLDDL